VEPQAAAPPAPPVAPTETEPQAEADDNAPTQTS
jgi:hypothetical protein